MASHFNDHFTSFPVELNRKIVKSKNMHLWYFGSIKESNMFLTPTTPNDTEVLIGNMKVNKEVRPNNIPTKILIQNQIINQNFANLLMTWSILLLQQCP